ncbi:MAG: bifunctional adenosylcobinamide kinase/adenosylcobinamide-phosphate guanylyltransferase [Dehalococcoidales bacterium]|nr:bifunctional adenosylcobinamide kinase/adenosylcobinamide-phosphate guanylyltransferase [Dehalococcoidales bacterium]
MGKCILVTGGARSGKSQFVLEQALKTGKPVLFVATAEAGDAEMQARIEAHKKSRPANWKTLEARTGLGKEIEKSIGDAQTVIIDCITLLTNNIFMDYISGAGKFTEDKVEGSLDEEIDGILSCIKRYRAKFYLVTNEVGLGIVPEHPMSRLYRDMLGKVNQKLAKAADGVFLFVAGIPVKIK